MSGLFLDLKQPLLSSWAMEWAWKSPHVMPFTFDKRDTKDPAHMLPNKLKNQRRRLDKNLKRQCAPSPLKPPSLSRAASLVLVPPARASSLPRAFALVAAVSL